MWDVTCDLAHQRLVRRTWATIATLLQTAKMNGVDPFAWLTQTLQCIAGGWSNRDLDQLLPFNHTAD